jgi:hypothetical protein
LYESLRADWQTLGGVGETSERAGARVRSEWAQADKPRSYCQAELVARGKWPEGTVRRMLGGDYFGTPIQGIGLSEFAKSNPAGYAQLELAKASYGIGAKSVPQAEEALRKASEVPAPLEIERTHKLETKLKDTFALPEQVNDETLENAAAAFEELAKAEAWKAVHDKAAEILGTDKGTE